MKRFRRSSKLNNVIESSRTISQLLFCFWLLTELVIPTESSWVSFHIWSSRSTHPPLPSVSKATTVRNQEVRRPERPSYLISHISGTFLPSTSPHPFLCTALFIVCHLEDFNFISIPAIDTLFIKVTLGILPSPDIWALFDMKLSTECRQWKGWYFSLTSVRGGNMTCRDVPQHTEGRTLLYITLYEYYIIKNSGVGFFRKKNIYTHNYLINVFSQSYAQKCYFCLFVLIFS